MALNLDASVGAGGANFLPFSVQMRLSQDQHAQILSRRLAGIFTSCGFRCKMESDLDSALEGVHIEISSHADAIAMMVCEAFERAGIKTELHPNPKLERSMVIVNVGRTESL